MKTLIIALATLALTATQTTNARTATQQSNYVLTSKNVPDSFTNILVEGDVDVILVQGPSEKFALEGYANQLEEVSLQVVNNTLVVATTGKIKGKNPVVYIPVSNLQFLKVKGNSHVTTLGYLTSSVVIEMASADCKVELKTTGLISISETSTQAYQIEKWIERGV